MKTKSTSLVYISILGVMIFGLGLEKENNKQIDSTFKMVVEITEEKYNISGDENKIIAYDFSQNSEIEALSIAPFVGYSSIKKN